MVVPEVHEDSGVVLGVVLSPSEVALDPLGSPLPRLTDSAVQSRWIYMFRLWEVREVLWSLAAALSLPSGAV